MSRTILLTGGTGYIGERLLRRLKREDLTVRCLTRRPELSSGSLP
jgi:nucleoside-diphosphate-sugar epimerase